MLSRRAKLAWTLAALGGVAALFFLGDERARGEPIRIAFAGPVSGSSADDGRSAVRAIELVLDRVNEAGGVGGRPFVLDVYDDRNDPGVARANASRIADQPDTVAVIGHHFSTCAVAAGEIYAERGLPALSAAATSVAVTADNPWYFRVIYNDRDQGRFIVAYLRAVLQAERFAVVHETDAYGAFLGEVMQETAPLAGIELSRRWSFDPDDPDLERRLAAIAREAAAAGAPRHLVLAMQPEAGVALVKALRDRGYRGQLIVSDALASQAFADGFLRFPEERAQRGRFTDGILASTPFLFDTGGPLAGAFMREYVERYGEPADWYGAFAADAATVVVEALRRATAEGDVGGVRTALREALAAIGPHEPVEGITGPTWFDARGDAEKPAPMGRYLRGDVVAAPVELDLVGGDAPAPPERLFVLGDDVLRLTDVAQVGVVARRFGEVDIAGGTFELDFDVWFRYRGDRGLEDVLFTNALEPVILGAPVEESIRGDEVYRRYSARGVFRSDTVPAPYGQHVLALSFRPRTRTRDDLVLAIDSAGMNLGRAGRTERGAPARRLLGGTEWQVTGVFVFQDAVEESALGNPDFLGSSRPFSQLTVGVRLRSQSFSLRSHLPPRHRLAFLGAAAAGLGLLAFAGGWVPRWLRFALQLAFAVLGLAAAEAVLGNWLKQELPPRQLMGLRRFFDILWWVLPAAFTHLAIERFVWTRAAERSGSAVPTLLRWFVATIIYSLALFSVIAFVFDYRLTGLLATSGVLAMVIGLAVQLNITNIFAGIALNLERPFKVGDWIMIHGRTPAPEHGVIGQVTDINWRTTRIRTADESEIVIPNGVISEKTITNFMIPQERSRFELDFNVDQSTPPDDVLRVIQAGLDGIAKEDPEGPMAHCGAKVRISGTDDNVIEYKVRYRFVPSDISPLKARHVVNGAVLRSLREAGIDLAYPVRHIVEEPPEPRD